MSANYRIAVAGFIIAMTPVFSGVANAKDTYLKIFGGWTIPQSEDFQLNSDNGRGRESGLDFDSGYAIGGAIGLAVTPNVNVEAEYVYRDADADLKRPRQDESTSTSSNAVMVNALYQFRPVSAEGGFRPYVGAGIGVGDLTVDGDDEKLESDYGFAYQLIAGIGYDVSYQASLFGEVRYFGINDQTVENDDYDFKSGFQTVDVLIGYSYKF